ENAWSERSIVWLSGVRRVGKTVLSHSLPDVDYYDCELPRVRRLLEDPEAFLGERRKGRIVLDEIHRLGNASELLKIAADHYPDVRILTTGSSTLEASAKFQDTLTGRKRNVWLTPMNSADLSAFGQESLQHRLLHGGLPPFFLAKTLPETEFQEWIDSYWAKDIQELFRLERRAAFQKLLELLLTQSGGIFEATRFAGPCEVNRQTITNYLSVLDATRVVHVIRPFSTRRSTEITSAPKVYAFDTGFVCFARGWRDLRREDLGLLWEHFVLNEMQSMLQTRSIQYWRDKRGHEIDFVIQPRGLDPIAIECKWSANELDPRNMLAFRRQYPQGANLVVAPDVDRAFTRHLNGVEIRHSSLGSLVQELRTPSKSA
ncbi:MAG: ATP-binding protein, partial [Candidatus Bipolaricaulota bacterium]|nr:ATP-binding protein [Candidatus Bipolaricaulota bacterium]